MALVAEHVDLPGGVAPIMTLQWIRKLNRDQVYRQGHP
jgi:phosphoribulokinase